MQAPAIVPSLQELKDVGSGFGVRQVVALLDEFAFQRGMYSLHRCVIPTIALAAHGAEHAVLPQSLAVLMRCELLVGVRVMGEARCGTPPCDGHVGALE